MATTLDREHGVGRGTVGSSRMAPRWAVGFLAAAALAAVAVASVAVLRQGSEAPAFRAGSEVQEAQHATGSLYTPQELAVMQAVAAGLVPEETLEGGVYLIKSLINQGLIPRETLGPRPVRPLYTPQEQAVMQAVAAGLVPEETLEGGVYLIKSLINQGLIPRETLDP